MPKNGKGRVGGLTPRERQEAKKAEAIAEFKAAVEAGTLRIRSMTDEERELRRVCICHQRVVKRGGKQKTQDACPLHGTGVAARAVRGTAA